MIIEGSNLIREAVQKGICMDALLISDIYPSEPWMEELSTRGVRVERVDAFLFEKITDARNGVGLLAIVDRPVVDESQFENCFRPWCWIAFRIRVISGQSFGPQWQRDMMQL